MTSIFARNALLTTGWQHNVRITLAEGKIGTISANATAQPGDTRVDTLLPALPNLHSHTFQRAMAGMTETRGESADSFWTWRDLMYRFLQHLTPDDIESIAAFAFMEMQEQGFGACAEFHYIHHAAGGARYAASSELSQRIMAAAGISGIGLTLLPVVYSYAGLGQRPLAENQLRFGNTLDQFLHLHAEARQALSGNLPGDSKIGIAPHSLRATDAAQLQQLASLMPDTPTHIHIAEQTREVDDVVAATGQRPVQWLLENVNVKSNWCLVHATHMTAAEVKAMALSGAVAGLCPLTEANLGDGIFEAAVFLRQGGVFGVGTDSNINISVAGELSTLEYSQRLRDRQRNVLAMGPNSTGHALYTRAAAGGAQALGRNCGAIETGKWADLVAIDGQHSQLLALKPQQLVDGWLFASPRNPVTELWSAGRHCVTNGEHVAHSAIEAAYRKTISRLVALL